MSNESEPQADKPSVESVVHTPGPWVYDAGCFYAACQLDENGQTYERPIAEMLGGRPENSKANARLIAAAPDMLAALQAIIKHQEIAAGSMATVSTTWNIAKSAVEKATGLVV